MNNDLISFNFINNELILFNFVNNDLIFYTKQIGLINTDFTYLMVLKIVKHIDVFFRASFLVHFYKISHPKKFLIFFSYYKYGTNQVTEKIRN